MSSSPRIAVIGLDCAEASLVFDELRGELPNLARLMEQGSYGALRSCHPPITVPAWACMTSGYDAGQLGIYGFRNRRGWDYEPLAVSFASSVNRPRIWDYFSAANRPSICLGVPQTFPIVNPPQGITVASFLTPDKSLPWTYPPEMGAEIDRVSEGDYLIDIRDFRTHDKARVLADIHTMTRRRFQAAKHLISTKPWDLFFMVEMGVDRLHHGFWHYCDPTHARFPGEDNPFRWALRDYYRELDRHIGELVEQIPSDVLLLVVSDHGAQPMQGGIAVNEWLVKQGYLVLKEYPSEPTPPHRLQIDWSKTVAWSEGGYYARIFLNVKGREPQGLIEPDDYENWRERLIEETQALLGPRGEDLGTLVCRPEDLFQVCSGYPPDLFCYWGRMRWRSVGTVGSGAIYVEDNDTGPDEANHDWSGIFISRTPLANQPGRVDGLNLLDVGVSLLKHAGLPYPTDSAGQPRIQW